MNLLTTALSSLPPWFKNLPMWVQAGTVAGGVGGGAGWAATRSVAVTGALGAASAVSAGGIVGSAQAWSAGSRAIGMGSFMTPGILGTFGMTPEETLASGQVRFKGWGSNIDIPGGGLFDLDYSLSPEALATKDNVLSKAGIKARSPGMLGLGSLGLNAFFVYQGYKEGGLGGAYDAMALNIATEASVYHWGYGVGLAKRVGEKGFIASNTKLAGHPLNLKLSTGLLRGVGAGVGGYLGQSLGLATGIPMAGTIGALGGAYVGGAPLRALAANPILVGGTMAALGAAAVSYGAYTVVKTAGKMGYAHRQMLRGVNTDGDMSSFMTQNALTMRGRSVQAIAKSHLNARSALGSEANFMHTAKNYNSRYR